MKADFNSRNNLSFSSSWYDKFFESLPNKNIKNPEKFNKIGHMLASPHWNRLALGIAAISTQPAFDYFNPRVDKDTAVTSALRTTAKIGVCTTVGFCVRGLSYKIAEQFIHGSKKEGSILLTPKEILKEKNPIKKSNMLKLHRNTFSTVLALIAMIFTNFYLDAPYTTKGANYLISKYYKQKSISGGEND